MGTLRNSLSNALVRLRACHVFGRNPNRCDTVMGSSDVSNVHASICWIGDHWTVLDHSRNGIKINNRLLEYSQERCTLKIDDLIQFCSDPDTVWIVEDLSPPTTMLVEVSGTQTIVLEQHQLLPNEHQALYALYQTSSGHWILESENRHSPLHDGDIVDIDGRYWTFLTNDEIETTTELELSRSNFSTDIHCIFSVSQNEEHVVLQLNLAKRKINLGERVHHYFLLLLARKRFEDADNNFDALSQGWIDLDSLAKMTGQTASHINIQVFRARSQLAKALPKGLFVPDLIERRRNELRLGSCTFEISRGSTFECSFIETLENAIS